MLGWGREGECMGRRTKNSALGMLYMSKYVAAISCLPPKDVIGGK